MKISDQRVRTLAKSTITAGVSLVTLSALLMVPLMVSMILPSEAIASPIDNRNTILYLEPGVTTKLYSTVTNQNGEAVLAPVTFVPGDSLIAVDMRDLGRALKDRAESPEKANRYFIESFNLEKEVPKLSRDGWVCGIQVIDNPEIDYEEEGTDLYQANEDLCAPVSVIRGMKASTGNYTSVKTIFREFNAGDERPILTNFQLIEEADRDSKQIKLSVASAAKSIGMISPLKGCASGCLVVTSEFNPKRKHPKLKVVRPHRGIDLRASVGTPVVTTLDGRILGTKVQRKGAGKYIIVNHAGNTSTRYLHLSKFKAKTGHVVKKGDVIGYSGMTGGISTGPHLHYEVRIQGKAYNPRRFLKDLLGDSFSWLDAPTWN